MMPLQIFEKHPEADAYRVGGFYSPYALVSQDKRFTDAELAAEYWRSRMSRNMTNAQSHILRTFASRPHASDSDYQ